MNNIEQAISFARQEYTRQGLDALYQKDFEEFKKDIKKMLDN